MVERVGGYPCVVVADFPDPQQIDEAVRQLEGRGLKREEYDLIYRDAKSEVVETPTRWDQRLLRRLFGRVEVEEPQEVAPRATILVRLDDDRCREVVDLLVQLGAESTKVYPSAKIYQPATITSEAES